MLTDGAVGPDGYRPGMRPDEPSATSPDDRVSALRAAVERAAGQEMGDAPPPEFSHDGGVTVFHDEKSSARLQPLGLRTRISLADGDEMVAEAEVDSDMLVARIAEKGSTYRAVAAALDAENGPFPR